MRSRITLLVVVAVAVTAAVPAAVNAFDRKPVTVSGLTPDNWGQSTTRAESQLHARYPGIKVVYCAGVIMAGDAKDSYFVQGMTRYWDKLVCAGYTYTTGTTPFALIYDAKGAHSWIIYRLKGVTISALQQK
jgi:hypothetical protein